MKDKKYIMLNSDKGDHWKDVPVGAIVTFVYGPSDAPSPEFNTNLKGRVVGLSIDTWGINFDVLMSDGKKVSQSVSTALKRTRGIGAYFFIEEGMKYEMKIRDLLNHL